MAKYVPNMVPAWEYVEVQYVPFAAIKKYHTPEQYKRFQTWIGGQTCIEHGCFPWDYSRWVQAGMPSKQGEAGFD